MKFVSDPSIAVKIRKMKERVRWQEPLISDRSIDQTRMVFDSDWADSSEFSFLVIGDSGAGYYQGRNPQRQIAEMMLAHKDNSRFMLHTGDVIYMVGSSEYYRKNFIEPYREFLLGGEHPKNIAYDQMVFTLPVLPVLGNHDYYDLPSVFGIVTGTTKSLRRLLRFPINLNLGWHGSKEGMAYTKAFIDYLKKFDNKKDLSLHLDRHYTAKTDTGRCLLYEPGHFTRLPNRYYTFRCGGIDFFALDSNTFNAPLPLPTNRQGEAARQLLEKRRDELEQQKLQIVADSANLNPDLTEEAEQLDDLQAKLEQIEEMKLDIDKQLAADEKTVTDFEQLDWLRQRLIESWHNQEVRGRVIYFHHPPYVTEATKWQQAQTLAIRYRLRQVFDAVSEAIGSLAADRPLVDLVLNGHAHCLEHLLTGDTGHADSHINYIVCGGSGFSLRRQRAEGAELMETFTDAEGGYSEKLVARSRLFLGRNGHGSKKRKPYSFLRIDVKDGCPPKFIVRPFVTELSQRQWNNVELEPFVI